jgi:hypothetical protein
MGVPHNHRTSFARNLPSGIPRTVIDHQNQVNMRQTGGCTDGCRYPSSLIPGGDDHSD